MKDTPTLKRARKWLADHGGHGVVDNRGRVTARGELGPITAATWLRLAVRGDVTCNIGRIALNPPTSEFAESGLLSEV